MPQRARAACARGARSPDEPRDPFSGTMGTTPAFSMSSRARIVEVRAPELPTARALARKRSIARTTSSGNGSPTPHAWLMMRLRWRAAFFSREITTSLNFPNPVVIPYRTRFSSTHRSTTAREASIRGRASGDNRAGIRSREDRFTSCRVRLRPSMMTGSM